MWQNVIRGVRAFTLQLVSRRRRSQCNQIIYNDKTTSKQPRAANNRAQHSSVRLEMLKLLQRAHIHGTPAASGLGPDSVGLRAAVYHLGTDQRGRRASVRRVGRRRQGHARQANRTNPGVLVQVGTAPPGGSGPSRPQRRSGRRRGRRWRGRRWRGHVASFTSLVSLASCVEQASAQLRLGAPGSRQPGWGGIGVGVGAGTAAQ